jgi:hypothetical protein
MQIKLLFRLVLMILPVATFGQSTYIRTGSAGYPVIDRLEIKTRSAGLSQSFVKPYSRKKVFEAIDAILNDSAQSKKLTIIDRYNLDKLISDPEWKWQPGASSLHNKIDNISIQLRGRNGFWVYAPVTRISYSKESGNDNNPFLVTGGFDTRGLLFKKIGFNLFATVNTERLPAYLGSWMSRYHAVPGIGDYKIRPDGKITYADIRGSVQTSVTRFIDLQLGYDRLFIGNGQRSLFLGDQSNSMPFFKINARVWKLDLQSLYIKLEPQDGIVTKKDSKKFLRLTTLGIDAAKWLNISFFDAVVLGRSNGFDLNYVLPLTFLRAMEQQSGSPDNALFGMNIKSNIAGKVQLYAQGILDEFKLTEIKAGNGWWANKFGYQLGAKYIDAFGIKNMDLQVETNRVRPFTYTHFDSISNYTHANQPLAHPLGANFHEVIGILKYQPIKQLRITARLVYYKQGLDSAGLNTGNNVLANYNTRPRSYSWKVGSGDKATCLYLDGLISYEVYGNLFIDVSVTNRNFKTVLTGEQNTTMFSFGMRWNISRREFDF